MALFDLSVLLACSFLLVVRTGVIPRLGERLALTLFVFFLLKGLELLLLVGVGETGTTAQSIASVVLLGGVGTLFLGPFRSPVVDGEPELEPAPPAFKLKTFAAIAALFILSLGTALWFPVTVPDGVWYQIRASEFLNAAGLSASVVPLHFRQYPPLVPLLFAWLDSAGWGIHKVLFPLSYLALSVILYFRLCQMTKNERLAGWVTLVFASTPYVWWHSQLALLNLMGGACFALGVFYWQEFIQRWTTERSTTTPVLPWLVLSGGGFGAASLIRPEFVLYSGIALVLFMVVLYRHPQRDREEFHNLMPVFVALTLGLPTLWAAVLLAVVPGMNTFGDGMITLIFLYWVLTLVWGLGWFRASSRGIAGLVLAGTSAFFTLVFAGNGDFLSPLSALVMGAYQTFGFHLFFGFSFLLWAMVFTARRAKLSSAQRYLMVFLAMFLAFHFALYSILPLESEASATYFNSLLLSPGSAVNSPAARGYLAWYPVFLFWVAGLPKMRGAFSNE